MSKYRVRYTSSTKGEMNIEDVPNGYLHNAARKLRAEVDAGLDVSDYQMVMLECLELEVAERAKQNDPPEADDPAFGEEA